MSHARYAVHRPMHSSPPAGRFQGLSQSEYYQKSLDKIAALFVVRMLGKEGGDFYPVVFECVTGAEQFGLFAVLMIVGDFGTGVKVVVADFQPCGAYCRPVDGGLRRFFSGGKGAAYASV